MAGQVVAVPETTACQMLNFIMHEEYKGIDLSVHLDIAILKAHITHTLVLQPHLVLQAEGQ